MKFNCNYSELRNIDSLVPHPKNPNEHSEEQIKRLSEIINYQGQRSPIVISRTSGYIVVGHGRWMAMKKLGWKRVAVDMQIFENDEQEFAHLTADNAISEWSVLDLAKINRNVENLGPDFDMDLLGLQKDFKIEPAELPDADPIDIKPIKDNLVTCPECKHRFEAGV